MKRPRIGFHAPIKEWGSQRADRRQRHRLRHRAVVLAQSARLDGKPLTVEDVLLFAKYSRTRITPVLATLQLSRELAAVDNVFLQKSRESFREVERALLLGVDYLVVHPGSSRGACRRMASRSALSLKDRLQRIEVWLNCESA